MSAPNYTINRKDGRVDARALRQPIVKRVYEIVDAHNAQFPGEVYTRAYYKRFKESELTTLLNIIHAWSLKTAREINQGKTVVDNTIPTNNRDARRDKRCKRGTPAHLGKAASTGLLLGRKATEDDAKHYQDRPTGQGCGWVPLKRYRGTKANYILLLAPELFRGVLPKGITLLEVEDFGEEKPENRDLPCLEKFASIGSETDAKAKNLHLSPLRIETSIKEGMSEAASADADRYDADGNTFDGNKNKAENLIPNLQKGLKVGPAAQKIAVETRGMRLSELATRGFSVARDALILVQFYLETIAVAMKRTYQPVEVERGRIAAIELLLEHPESERNAWMDEYVATIDRMAGAIEHDPEKWAAPPGQWLHPHCDIGIRRVREAYLIPWRKTAESFDFERKQAKKAAAAARASEQEFAQVDWYAWVAQRMKNRLMQLHPGDSFIRKAKLTRYRESVKDLVEKDLMREIQQHDARLEELVHVWNWFATHPSKQAEFWRKEVCKPGSNGKKGIRSAGGFRRNFPTIRKQFHEQQAVERRERIKAATMPKTKDGKKVLPSIKHYNPHR